MSKEDMMNKADEETIIFIKKEIKDKSLTTRKEITDYWNQILMTIAFQEGENLLNIPKLRGDKCQRRIESRHNVESVQEQDWLQFTYVSKKGGEIVVVILLTYSLS